MIETFAQVDPSLTLTWRLSDGDRLEAGSVIGTVEGHLRTVLTAERTALNFLSHLSGVATNTAAFVDRAAATGSSTRVWDTRKTTPGLRSLQKAAVRAGGGRNHRANLSDAIMVKVTPPARMARAAPSFSTVITVGPTSMIKPSSSGP